MQGEEGEGRTKGDEEKEEGKKRKREEEGEKIEPLPPNLLV